MNNKAATISVAALVRELVKVPRMHGRGKARYRLSPHVGWNDKLESQA